LCRPCLRQQINHLDQVVDIRLCPFALAALVGMLLRRKHQGARQVRHGAGHGFSLLVVYKTIIRAKTAGRQASSTPQRRGENQDRGRKMVPVRGYELS